MTRPPDIAAPSAGPTAPAHAPSDERRGLYRELAQSAQEIRLFDRVLAAVNSASDQDELIHTIGFGLKELLPYERWSRVSLALLDAAAQQLDIYQLIGERNNPFWDNIGEGIRA